MASAYDAVVVGAGPNGLAAAIVLAQAGRSVVVFEANETVGGAARSAALTRPGFVHDLGSAIHPMAVGSPFFQTLPLERYGLRWIHPDAPLAHPLDDGSAAVLHRTLEATAAGLGPDGPAYRRLMEPFVTRWQELMDEFMQPLLHVPRHPLLLARFGLPALLPAQLLCNGLFKHPHAKALFAGIAAHAKLPLSQPGTAAFGLVLGLMGHAVGWPLPQGGAQKIADALAAHLRSLGGEIVTGHRVENIDALPQARATLLDVTPRQLLRLAGHRLPAPYRRRLEGYRYGPAAFKVDFALDGPIPWKAHACAWAGTVHLGGTLDEIALSEKETAEGKHPERPYVLLAQHSPFDATRAPEGKHTVWTYCHVPLGSTFDMTERIEQQIERFAPGFRDRILDRHVSPPAALEDQNANLIGGDVTGGSNDLWQFAARPVLSPTPYRTPVPGLYLCSASTPPGGGVHGMCGYNAARLALRDMR